MRPHRFRRATKILLTTQMIATGVAGMLLPLYAVFAGEVGGDILETAGAYAAFAFAGGAMTIVLGKFTDKVKEAEYFIVAGFMVAALGYGGYLLVRNPAGLFLVQAVLGLAVALMTPAHDALYTKHMDTDHLALEWGIWEGLWYITEAVAAVIGGVIVSYFGFKALFVVMSLFSLLTGVYILLLPRRVL